jgi:4-amino-4-deoxy-L-arabinose transferase-like glycosyltransferase
VVHSIPLLNDAFDNRPAWTPPPHEKWVRIALLLYCALVFLPNLGAFGLWDPWETHYGAVTTNMVETHEWISPWWGYKEQIGTEAQQGKYFFSKPIFIFWAQAFFSSVIGHGEWAMRLPMALLSMFVVFGIYMTLSMLWCRTTGLIGAVVVATSPQFFMISRQAQTDMLFVATLTLGLCALLLALFGPVLAVRKSGFWKRIVACLGFLALNTIPQYAIIATDLNDAVPSKLSGIPWLLATIQFTGLIHVLLYSLGLVGILSWFAWELRRDLKQDGYVPRVTDKWLRRSLLIIFYIIIAQSTYAKGLLGFALPGLFVLVYLALSGQWKILKRVELIRGIGICLAVGLPWYVAMFARHGNAFYQRFFIHDHFNRLASGVHQIDTGNFEHFVKWLGFGMYPWTIFAPVVCIWLLMKHKGDRDRQYYARLFIAIWFAISFAFFTFASTKFHHYIFPALPALGMLIAIFLAELMSDRGWLPRLTTFVAFIFFAILIRDLQSDPQHLRNLMTYKIRPTDARTFANRPAGTGGGK